MLGATFPMDSLFLPFRALSNALTYGWLRLPRGTPAAETVSFFLYDAPKVLAILAAMMFLVALLRTFLSPEKVRDWAAKRGPAAGYASAAALGVATPFCSCSAVPVFMGLAEGGVPLRYAFTFLVASPLVNEVAVGLLLAGFGPLPALAYAAAGVAVAVGAGWAVSRGDAGRFLESASGKPGCGCGKKKAPSSWPERFAYAGRYCASALARTAPFVLLGVGLGAAIHGYVPQDFLASFGSKWYAVPLATAVGAPLYGNHAAILPAAQALLAKGVPMGVVLSFVMSVTALSLPEFVLLRRVMKPALVARFALAVTAGIVAVGYLFLAFL